MVHYHRYLLLIIYWPAILSVVRLVEGKVGHGSGTEHIPRVQEVMGSNLARYCFFPTLIDLGYFHRAGTFLLMILKPLKGFIAALHEDNRRNTINH